MKSRVSCERNDCCVVLLGDSGVGKTSLVNRIKNQKTILKGTNVTEKLLWSTIVADRKVEFTIFDTTGDLLHSHQDDRASIYDSAHVFLLCFNISNPSSLVYNLSQWSSDIRKFSPGTPLILVGCQADLRHEIRNKGRHTFFSAKQGLEVSHQIGALLYIESSSISSARSALSVFEVAALAYWGQLSKKNYDVSSSFLPKTKQRSISVTTLNQNNIYSVEPSRRFVPKLKNNRSLSSLLHIDGSPKNPRKNCTTEDSMVTFKCEILTAQREYEEIDVQVPSQIYETLRSHNRRYSEESKEEKNSFRRKIRKLFAK